LLEIWVKETMVSRVWIPAMSWLSVCTSCCHISSYSRAQFLQFWILVWT